MTLEELLPVAEGVVQGGTPEGRRAVVRGVRHDSRQVTSGDLFVALRGAQEDGARFVPDAVARGAVAVMAETGLEGLPVPVLVVSDARRALGKVSEAVYGRPTTQLACVGITGTNGKTTTTWILDEALRVLGKKPALLGTVVQRIGDEVAPTAHTTPEGDDLARFARKAVDAGATHLVMEVSSHGLALHRVDGVMFAVVGFTNLTQDHLDFHGTLAAYEGAKARLFTDFEPAVSVINVDDPAGARLVKLAKGRVLRCSVAGNASADVAAVEWSSTREGITARLRTPDGEQRLSSPLLGAHNLENLLVACGCLLGLGVPAADAVEALSKVVGAPGRLERVAAPKDVAVFVDYAHTPDALTNILRALRPLTPGRLIVVFGCGGDRDRTKRPEMARAVDQAADLAVLTSDNPRTEEPMAIIRDALSGFARLPAVSETQVRARARGHVVVPERRQAIRLAVKTAGPGDTVVIAGKGHENYQIIGKDRVPFDDRVEARRALDGVEA